jgi:hypothetical protein
MKKRFLLLLAALIALMSVTAVLLSFNAVRQGVEKLVLEQAKSRLSIMIFGFNATARDVDIYSYVDFAHEIISIKKGALTVFQYGTASLQLGSPSVRKIERANGSYVFTLFLDLDAEAAAYLNPFRLMIAITSAIYAALFAAAGWVFIRMVVDPIAGLAARMSTITSRNLRTRIPEPRRRDEIHQLIHTFNSMLDEISDTYDRQARFVEDMTHDIVTPVQILDGYRQLIERHGKNPKLIDEYLDVSKVELARLRNMTGLLKAALFAEKRRRTEFADASGITSRNVAYYRALFPELVFDADIEENVTVPVDASDLERIENILIDNAVKYGRDGGRIEIGLREGELVIRDFGAGMAEPGSAFERHRRGPGAGERGQGAGIGLSIVKAFSEEYGFEVALESAAGAGCTYKLRFAVPGPGE